MGHFIITQALKETAQQEDRRIDMTLRFVDADNRPIEIPNETIRSYLKVSAVAKPVFIDHNFVEYTLFSDPTRLKKFFRLVKRC